MSEDKNKAKPTEIEETKLDDVSAAGPGDDLDIQIRTRTRGGYSDIKRVAIKIGSGST